jgi:hypothetical protein
MIVNVKLRNMSECFSVTFLLHINPLCEAPFPYKLEHTIGCIFVPYARVCVCLCIDTFPRYNAQNKNRR